MAEDQTTIPAELNTVPADLMEELNSINKEDEGGNDQLDTVDKETSKDAPKDDELDTPEKVTDLDEDLFKEEKKEPKVDTKKQDREKVRQATIDNATKRVVDENGEINQEKFDKLPSWVQAEIENNFTIPDTDPLAVESDQSHDLKALVDKAIRERDDEREFKIKLEEIYASNKLSSEQQKSLSQEFKQLTSLGMSKSDSIEKAALICGFGTQSAVEAAKKDGVRIGRMALPPEGNAPEKKSTNKEVDYDSDDSIIEMLKGI